MRFGPSVTRFFKPAFFAVMIVFALVSLVAFLELRGSERESAHLIRELLSSAELSRIDRDLDAQQLALDAHVLEQRTANMLELERQMSAATADLAVAVQAYENSQGQGEAKAVAPEDWRTLKAEIAGLDPAIARVLELSRANRDDEAHAAMATLLPQFESIDRAGDRLVAESREKARGRTIEMVARQRLGLIVLTALSALGIGLASTIMFAVLRYARRGEAQLWQATTRLEDRNRELDAFAGRVAHDLRGPLTTIILAAARLAEHAPEDPSANAILRRSVARMEALIRDLLTLSQVDSQAPGVGSDPAVVAASVAEELAEPVAEAGESLEVEVAAAKVRCSDGLLRALLWNLLDNAIKYRGKSAPRIRVEGHRAGEGYELRISDNGIGMSSEDARRAFDPFYRGRSGQSGQSDATGSGLGLSIVKRIVETSGGTITVESKLDRGTTFIVDLPLVRMA